MTYLPKTAVSLGVAVHPTDEERSDRALFWASEEGGSFISRKSDHHGTFRRSRGRPKGSGIDDSAQLLQLVNVMSGNPAVSATWVIRKVLNVTHPSVVRRLRNKLHGLVSLQGDEAFVLGRGP